MRVNSPLFRPARFRQAGDTIVEVLIAVSIVGLILVSAYIVTTHNTNAIQDAQERSQALQLVQSQVEFLRLNHPFGSPNICFDNNGSPQARGTLNNDPCTVSASGSMITNLQTAPAYKLTISGSDSTVYQVTATWDSLVTRQQDVVTMYYEVQ